LTCLAGREQLVLFIVGQTRKKRRALHPARLSAPAERRIPSVFATDPGGLCGLSRKPAVRRHDRLSSVG
jgi:hypothetical protein